MLRKKLGGIQLTVQETTIHLKSKENISQVESYINGIEGVQRSLVDVENRNAVIQYDGNRLSEEDLKNMIKQFI
jgi:copper chaperone CopZ